MNNLTISDTIKNETNTLATQAIEFQITSRITYDEGSEIVSSIKKMTKAIKLRKEEITKPLNAGLKSARELFKPYEDTLKEAEDILKGKIIEYSTVIEEENTKKRLDLLKDIDPTVDDPELNTKLAELSNDKKLSGDIHFRNNKEVVITDEKLVPKKYWQLNLILIRKDLISRKIIPGAKLKNNKTIASSRII